MHLANIAVFACLCFVFLDKGAAQQEVAVKSTVDDSIKVGVDNYILLNRRQYSNVIIDMERVLTDFRSNFANQVSTIDTQSTLLEKRLNDVAAILNPLDVLTAQSRTCVQKYRGRFATVDSVRTSLANCAASSTNSLATYLSAADTTKRNLATYYASNFEQLLTSCSKTYPVDKALSNYTDCVETSINTVNTITVSNQKTFDTQIQTAKCTSESKIKESLDCSFSVQYNAIAGIGEYTRLINNCIDGLESCPVCKDPTPPSATSCAYGVQITSADAAITNEKINNPFSKVATQANCVIITKTA